MGYDGKIKNGLILKKSEDGFFLRTIKKIISNNEVWYKLSYDEQEHKYFDKEFLIEYLNEKYLDDKNKEIDENNLDDKNKEIYEKNLINDLITLKTYRDSTVQTVNNQDNLNKILVVFLTIATTFYTAIRNIETLEMMKIKFMLFLFMITIVYISFIYNVLLTTTKSESYKLKVINNVIYTLEAIKEDMDKNGYASMKYTGMNSNVNDYQRGDITDEMSTEVKCYTENDKDMYDGLKLTEVREIRTYKATKNKYSPRAMYERKRH